MNNKELFQKLVTQADKEIHPHTDVSESVLKILYSKQASTQVISYKPLAWVASVSTAAAACILAASYFVWQASTADAMTDLYQMISWVAQ
ncbi:MAG: hypothetical protein ACYTEE_11105 [Planctomycetota bacterium]|jgi:hypothetical protein